MIAGGFPGPVAGTGAAAAATGPALDPAALSDGAFARLLEDLAAEEAGGDADRDGRDVFVAWYGALTGTTVPAPGRRGTVPPGPGVRPGGGGAGPAGAPGLANAGVLEPVGEAARFVEDRDGPWEAPPPVRVPAPDRLGQGSAEIGRDSSGSPRPVEAVEARTEASSEGEAAGPQDPGATGEGVSGSRKPAASQGRPAYPRGPGPFARPAFVGAPLEGTEGLPPAPESAPPDLPPPAEVPELPAGRDVPDTVRVQVDDELAVEVRADGEEVEVTLLGPERVRRPLAAAEGDLRDHLRRGGYRLARYEGRDDGDRPGRRRRPPPFPDPEPEVRRPRRAFVL